MAAFTRQDWETLLREFKHVLEYRGYIRDIRVDTFFGENDDGLFFQMPLLAEILADPNVRKLLKADVDTLVETLNLLVPSRMQAPDGGAIWGGQAFADIQAETYNYDVVGLINSSSGGGSGSPNTINPKDFDNAADIQEVFDGIFHPISAPDAFWAEVDLDENEFEYEEPNFPVANNYWFSLYVFIVNGLLVESHLEKGAITNNTIQGASSEVSLPSSAYEAPAGNHSIIQVIGFGPNSLDAYDFNYLLIRFLGNFALFDNDYSEEFVKSLVQNYSMNRQYSLSGPPSHPFLWWENRDTGPFFSIGAPNNFYSSTNGEPIPQTPDIAPLIRDAVRDAAKVNNGEPEEYEWSCDYTIQYGATPFTAVFGGQINQQVAFDGSQKGSNSFYESALDFLNGNVGSFFYIVYDDDTKRFSGATTDDLEALDDTEILYIYKFVGFPAISVAADSIGSVSGSGLPAGPINVAAQSQPATITAIVLVSVIK